MTGKEDILLMGVVAYHGVGGLSTRRSCERNGHYTSLAYKRGNGSWMEADDFKTKTIFRSDMYKVGPRLLMYIRSI